jgi:hypothetical protein
MDSDYFRAPNYSQKIWHVASNPNAASFAYERLKLHRASAVVQMSRIWEAAKRSRANTPEPAPSGGPAEIFAFVERSRERLVPVLFEIHFYLVAWTNCGHMMTVLTSGPEFLGAKKVFDSYKKTFDHYAHGRNSFEHFHDRLPGRKDARRVKQLQEPGAGPRHVYFGVEGQNYKHSDQLWDISPTSLALLNHVVDEVTDILHQRADALLIERFGAT